jgi:purine-binding chemotaxis protein CheW
VSDNAGRQLFFTVGDHLFAADAKAVREIVEADLAATPIPGAIPAVRGLINLRGTLLVAGSLAALLEIAPRRPADPMLVVFEHETRQVALEVDRVVDVSTAPGGLAAGERTVGALTFQPMVSGAGRYRGQTYYRLDMHKLFARLLESEEEAGDDAVQTDGGAG